MNASFQQLCEKLSAAGVPDARYDAAELYRFVTGRDPRLDAAPTPAEAESWRHWQSAALPASRCNICWENGIFTG